MKKILLFVFLMLISFQSKVSSQSSNPVHSNDTIAKSHDIRFYGNLYHQHHDFFHNVFSFQGAELGVMIDRSLLLGIYSSAFASNLNVEIQHKSNYVWMAQSGISVGKIWNERKWIHPGCQLNAGYFWLKADENNFTLFNNRLSAIQVNGLVFSPQVFGEFNVCKWFKIRTGLSYNFYNYADHSIVQTTDLQNISFTFGMVFGKFDK
jgi:hypothetical protein